MCYAARCLEWQVKLAASPIFLPEDPSEFLSLIAAKDRALRALTRRLGSKAITPSEWRDAMESEIEGLHTEADLIGQRMGGLDVASTLRAEQIGRIMRDIESQYLNDFLAKIEDEGYLDDDGELNEDAIYHRQRLYLGKARGTGNQAFVDVSPGSAKFDWDLGLEDNCPDCPVLAGGGPYTKETLYTTPGAGDTVCLGNCGCVIRRSDGVVGIEAIRYGDPDDDLG